MPLFSKVRHLGWVALAAVPLLLASCSALHPRAVSLDQRLAMFPTDGAPLLHPVTIRWNDAGVPWIEAESDHDLAVALGMVHAHLRLGQMAIMRAAVQGRLSEAGGPFGQEIDRALRTIDFGYAAGEIEAKLPPATRDWLAGFVEGLNWYQAHAKAPPEYGLLALRPEPWTIRDLIAIGRLAGTDVNWLMYPTLLKARLKPEWPEIWQRTLAAGTNSTPSFASGDQAMLWQFLQGSSRSGSNALAIAPWRSETGAALLEGDPHLGLTLPNFWLLVGIKSPSYHAVGFMVPGLPIIGLGRNDDIAWAGTNMRAAQSELINVAGEKDISERRVHIKTRDWFDKNYTIRRSKEGPIVSDLAMFPARPGEVIALRWKGYEASDEFSAFLAAMKATTAQQFRQAFESYGVGGQNMICATRQGDICQVMAAHIPIRDAALPADLVRRADDAMWRGTATATTLPFALNPPDGVLASANNRAAPTPFPLGFFYPTSERVERLYALAKAKDKIGIPDLERLQQDTLSTAAVSLRDRLMPMLKASPAALDFVRTIAVWDGHYDADKPGPVAFETLLYELATRLYGIGKDKAVPAEKAEWDYLVAYLPTDLAAEPDRQTLIDAAIGAAAKSAAEFPTWGDMHRLRVAHMLSFAPMIGGYFSLGEFGDGGSRNTVMKTAHGLVSGKHYSTYGSQARQLCDLSDPDGCRFVLFGGEDGWLGSANFADQVPLWRQGRTMAMPLTAAKVAAEFPRKIVLQPK